MARPPEAGTTTVSNAVLDAAKDKLTGLAARFQYAVPEVGGRDDRVPGDASHGHRRSLEWVPTAVGKAPQASGEVAWGARFERNGRPVAISGAPGELTGPVVATAVQVAEARRSSPGWAEPW